MCSDILLAVFVSGFLLACQHPSRPNPESENLNPVILTLSSKPQPDISEAPNPDL